MAQKNTKKPSTSIPVRAYGYVRVSTDEQAEHGLSLRAQRKKIRDYAALHNLKLVKIYADEGISGRTLDRPSFHALLDIVKNRADETVIVYRLSRLSRSTRDLLFLIEDVFQQGNTRLISITEHIDTRSSMGRFFLTIMAALAQMERELIAERTKAALAFKREQGQRLGAAPYGFRINDKGDHVPVPKELKVVKRIFALRKKDHSYAAIADQLNKDNVPTKRGKAWYPSTVRYIVTSDRYQNALTKKKQ